MVTGSRIVRRDYTSNSPIITLNSQTFENTSNVAIENTLNKLPQFTPDQNLTGFQQSGDVQPTASHTVGISTLSLRGLGPNRNLVLVDGERLMPTNGELAVDVNSIPSAMIDRVEVITGGASAVYGPDAVGGVVNFILKKNYQGLTVDSQYGETQAGDGQEFKISALAGTNFADDKGNVTFGLEQYSRSPSYQANRDFFTKGWDDPSVASNEFFVPTMGYTPGAGTPPDQSIVNSTFPLATGTILNSSTFNFQGDGTVAGTTLWTGAGGLFGANGAAGFPYYTGPINTTINGQHWSVQNALDAGTVKPVLNANSTDYYVTSPLQRWSAYGSANYDINDWVSVFGNFDYITTHTHTILFPSPFITGWTTEVPYDAAHPVPTQLATLLNSRPAPATATVFCADGAPGCGAAGTMATTQTALVGLQAFGPTSPWQLNFIPYNWIPPRSDDVDNSVFQTNLGLKGKLPLGDWTWEVYGSHGQSDSYDLGLGYASLSRFQALIESPDYGAGQSLKGNPGNPNNGFGSAAVTCTSGFGPTIFSNGTIAPSKDCVDAITAKLQSRTLMKQNIMELNFQGTLFDLPAGPLQMSLGADYRDDTLQYTPDILQSTVSFLDQVVGVYPTAYMSASTSVREGYGEFLVPIVKDLPLIKRFNLELGWRYSTYTGADQLNNVTANLSGGWTYKALGDWQVTDWLRLRGGYNVAVRAPNLAELFLGKQEVYAAGAATAYGDPCTLASNAPFGAGGADNATFATTNPGAPAPAVFNAGGLAGAQSALRICKALMGATGSTFYYGNLQPAAVPSPFGFVEQEGNSNVKSEEARTFTGGVVLTSPWQTPLLSRLTASIDWYWIKIAGAIEFQSVDNIKAACLTQSAPDDATAAIVAASPACQLLLRNPGTGQEDVTTIQYDNLASIWTSGIDMQLDWSADLAELFGNVPGTVGLNVSLNWLDYFNTQAAPGSPILKWAGSQGPDLTGLNAGAFDYKLYTTFSYSLGPGTVSLRWRHLPKTVAEGAIESPATNVTLPTDAYDEFDLSGTWAVSDRISLRAGIDNLLDKEPPIQMAAEGIPGFTLASSGQGQEGPNTGFYDELGRRFYGGITLKF